MTLPAILSGILSGCRLGGGEPAPALPGTPFAQWDLWDTSTVFSDAGTTPATPNSDTIYQINDKSGNGHHFVQTTDTKRPLYKESGGLYWAETDGVDDFMQTAAFPGGAITQPITHGHSFHLIAIPSAETRAYLVDGRDSGGRNLFFIEDDNDYDMWSGSYLTITDNDFSADTGYTVSAVYDGASSLIRVNGTEDTGNPGTLGLSGVTLGMSYNTTQFPINMKYYGGVIYNSDAEADIPDIETYLDWMRAA